MLAVWGNGTPEKELSLAKRQGAVSKGECMNSPINPHSHSPQRPCLSGTKTLGDGKVAREIIKNLQGNTLNPDPWARLIGRANEEQILVNGKPVTTLLDTDSQVTHISHDYCQAKGIPINPISQLVNIEGTEGYYRIFGLHWGEIIPSNGAPYVWDWGPPTFHAHYRVSEEGTCNYRHLSYWYRCRFLGPLDQTQLSTSWKTVYFTTQSRRQVQAQQLQKSTVKITKPITLPPFSTTVVKGHTTLNGHGMRLNLIAEPSEINQLPPSVQCTPT